MSPAVGTPYQIRPKKMATLTQLPFIGMRDSKDPQSAHPQKAYLLQNCYPLDVENGGAVIGRPGFDLTENTQLGGAGARLPQRFYQFTRYNSSSEEFDEYTIAFVGAKMYTYDWSGGTWSEVTLTGVSLTATAKVYCTTFLDELVVNPNDGTNKSFTWDGTTFTSLTNAPLMSGPIVVHYAKLFGIKYAERSTIVWSEEADPTTGYEAGGFNNAWTLGTTAQGDIYCLYATNEALYYWRESSIGAIYGQVNANFSTTGVREAVSEDVGSKSPDAIVGRGGRIYFPDRDGRPYVLRTGLGETAIYQDAAETIAGLDVSNIVGVAKDDLVLFGYTNSSKLLVYYDQPGVEPLLAGVYQGFDFEQMDVVKNGDGDTTILHAEDDDGYVYYHGQPDGSIWEDGLQAGDQAITHVVEGFPLGFDTKNEKYFDRVDLSLRNTTDGISGLTLGYTTPVGTGSVSPSDLAAAAADGTEAHRAAAIAAHGRWCRIKLTHATSGERFGVEGWSVEAYHETSAPAVS